MLGQHRIRCASIATTLAACDCPAVCVFACMVSLSQRHTQQHSADTRRRWINVGSTFLHHLRRWTNVKPTLFQRLVSAGLPIHMYGAYIICLSATHCPTKQTFTRCGIMLGELHRQCSNIKQVKKTIPLLWKLRPRAYWCLQSEYVLKTLKTPLRQCIT